MRFQLRRLMVACLAATACTVFPGSDFPESARPFVPPPQFRVWWEVVEACSGRRAPFDAVSWFQVPVGELAIRGETAAGAWFVFGNRIAIVNTWLTGGGLVRHEMLHAILETGDHPKEYFQQKCADVVACGRDCVTQARLPGAREVSIDVLEVDAMLYPGAPSLSEHGEVTVVVRVRNPANGGVFLPIETFTEARCAVGFQISMASEPLPSEIGCGYPPNIADDARVYFGPGETVRLLFETNLGSPIAFRRPIIAGPAIVSAIMADNLRLSHHVTILP